jgi:hypothetical protein
MPSQWSRHTVVAHLFAVAVEGQRQIVDGVCHPDRDDFFGVLKRADVVGPAGDRNGQAIGAVIGQAEQIAAGLAGRIRAARAHGIALEAAPGRVDVAIHLVGRDLVIALDLEGAGGLEQLVGAVAVGHVEGARRLDRAVDVRIGGEVDDDAGVVAAHGVEDGLAVGDIAPHERIAALELGRDVDQVVRVAGVGEFVVDDDVPIRVALQSVADVVGADKPGPAGDEDVLHGRWIVTDGPVLAFSRWERAAR